MLSEMPLQDIYDKKQICKCHFSEKNYNTEKKALFRTAVLALMYIYFYQVSIQF